MDERNTGNPTTTGGGIDRRAALAGGAAALLAAALGAARPARAQEATPAAGGLPPGVELVELPALTPFALPEEPAAVRVFWLLMGRTRPSPPTTTPSPSSP
jgi:hypothetical protein